MSEDKKRYYVAESFRESVFRDLITFLMTVGIIGVGVFLESDAMQWAGFVMVFVVLLGWTSWKPVKKVDPSQVIQKGNVDQ